MANNNEKILVILNAMNELDPLMNNYLLILKKRYTWSKEAQADFYSIRRSLHQVSSNLEKIVRQEKRKEKQLEELTLKVRKEAEILNDYYIENVDKKGERGLEELMDLKQVDFTPRYAGSMKTYLTRVLRGINHSRLNYALERRQELKEANIEREEAIIRVSQRLKAISARQVRSLKTIKLEHLKDELHPLITEMKRYEINDQIDVLNNKIMRIDNYRFDRPPRPSYKEITAILNSIIAQENRIVRGYTVLDYAIPLYDSLNHLRQSIWAKREYVGTLNAYEAFKRRVVELESYYKKSYKQANGKPKNYHGHYAGEYE